MLQQDTLFADRYQLRSLIGRGGFSEVWLAHDTWTDLDIAIKVYAPGQGLDSDGLKEFCQELAGVHHLTHPNLLKPDHVDQWENMPYLIMEYCPKGALNKQVGKLSEEQVWKVLHDVAAGLAYLHSKDIVHQDIKPDNILLDESGNYRITDFGISTKARTTLRKSMLGASTSGGTMAYMGPERFSAQPAPTKASDIWSLGAMIYELITGDVPFGEIGGGMQKNGAEIPDIAKPISPALTHTIHLMLAKETWDRPTAETLATWAANPSLIKPIEPTKSASEATTAAGGRPTTMFNSADLVSNTSSATNSTTTTQRPTQRVATPHVQPKPQVKAPDAPDKPKKNKGILIFFITIIVIVSGVIAIASSVNNQGNHYSSPTQNYDVSDSTTAVVEEVVVVEEEAEPYLTVSYNNLHFGASSGSKVITVSSNANWKLTYTQSNMFTVSRNGSQVTVQCSANTTSDVRTDWFEITTTDGSKTIRIDVKQDGVTRNRVRTTTKTLSVDSKILRTDYHLWKVLKIELTPDKTILYERVTPRISDSYICCDGSEYIEDADTGKKYYITYSGIGMSNNPTILNSDAPYEFTCTYPVIPESVRAINIWSGSQYCIKNFVIR